jgi:methionyl-tRNA synthetase
MQPLTVSRQDGNFSEESFRETVNAELANTVGNMLNRWVLEARDRALSRPHVGSGTVERQLAWWVRSRAEW